jgi:oligosaccharyltransferase complex subunit alpha (ribophorin I)
LAIQSEFSNNLSYLQISRGVSDEDRKVLETKKIDSTTEEYVLYSTKLGQKLEKGKTDNLHIVMVFTHTMIPFPHEITQSERQYVKYSDNHYWYSVYKTETVKTKLKLSSTYVQHYRELQPFSVKGDLATYGPYKDIPPLSHSLLSLHFENNSPFITIDHLQRLVEVSNWGNIAIEEMYKISHDGAKLKGTFSRYDFQISNQANGQVAAVQILDINLPELAADVYYRDDIGNISTSALRLSKPKQKLELRPRFPMFGGWKTEFTLGYNMPTSAYLGTEYSSGKYILRVPFIPDWEYGITITDHVLKVILPEGSSDVSVKAPFDVSNTQNYTVTYLDSKAFGRPVVLISKPNLANIHNQIIEISYRFNSLFLLWEPILLIGSYTLIFLFFIACLRLDLSIEEVKLD